MPQRSGFNRNNLAFFVFLTMRILPFWLGISISLLFACSSKQNDPIEGQSIQPIKVKRFDTAFFAMDTTDVKKGVEKMSANYPDFSKDYFTRILQLDPNKDTQEIKKYFKELLPLFKKSISVNTPENISSELNKTLARFHFYFPSYKMPDELIYYISPVSSSMNVLGEHYLGVGLQIIDYKNYSPNQIPFFCVQNLLDDYLFNHPTEPSLLYQMIDAGKRQYILETICLQMPDSLVWNFSSMQLKALQEQESEIWQYLLDQHLLLSKERIDYLNFMGEADHNSLLGTSLPGNIGKYIGYRIVSAFMKKQAKGKFENLEKLAVTPASIIYAGVNYHP